MLAAAMLAAAMLGGGGAMWTDWRRREVPHGLVLGLAGLWCAAAVSAPTALGGEPGAALACGGAALAVGFLLFQLGWLGGGDGKLVGVLALWLGPQDLAIALVASAMLMLLMLLMSRVPGGIGLGFRSRGIPFACAVVPPAAALLAARALDASAA